MCSLWRNLLTLLIAQSKRDSAVMQSGCSCTFWVTPFDVGIGTLKSGKYLQLAKAAQLDFGVRSGLLVRMRRAGCVMVNTEQLVQFMQPVKLFDRVLRPDKYRFRRCEVCTFSASVLCQRLAVRKRLGEG